MFKPILQDILELDPLESLLPLLLRDDAIWPAAMRRQCLNEINAGRVGFSASAIAGMPYSDLLDKVVALVEERGSRRINEAHVASTLALAAKDGWAAVGIRVPALLDRLQEPKGPRWRRMRR